MIPEQPISYPEFVADQLLTASHLNELFHFLDVQERGARINLMGIGIVCGLELQVLDDGTEITLSKGCGITSQGYLVRWDEKSFQNYKAYDVAREQVYELFYSGGAQRFPIDELKANSSEEGLTKLSAAYLADKVALLFVELLREDAKNCNPESCDDKGRTITLSLRPLLVNRKDALYLSGGLAGKSMNQAWKKLPELKMPRHHVPAEDLFDCGDVLAGFQKVMDAQFLKQLEKNLSACYLRLRPIVQESFPDNPFANLADDFAFINNGNISSSQLLFIQYYYDLFSDVLAAYNELRKAGMELLSLCCPDENLFPRHLLLGLVNKAQDPMRSELRQGFIPSPALCCHGDLIGALRSLFTRLVLLLKRFSVPGSTDASFNRLNAASALNRDIARSPIHITPSRLGDVSLSEKAIPFYYNVMGGTQRLLDYWNRCRTIQGTETENLSYHAALYAQNDETILRPLQFDLEPYNFLRIEGHVGHRYTDALATINQIKDANRLPFDVVALSADVVNLREQMAAISGGTSKTALRENVQDDPELNCHFQDLEALYDTMARGLICQLCKEMKYYYDFPAGTDKEPTLITPEVPLLRTCDPDFKFRSNSLGAAFEAFYKTLPAQYIQPEQFLSSTSINKGFGGLKAAVADNTALILGFALLYYIEKLSEVLPTSLSGFSIAGFTDRYSDLMAVALAVKKLQQAAAAASAGNDNELNLAVSEDIIDHLDSLLYACKDATFIALYNDYKLRWIYLSMLQKFGFYARLHPGFQHKAGVPMGGTFILVYHERQRVRKATATNIFLNTQKRSVVTNLKEDVALDEKELLKKAMQAKEATINPQTAGSTSQKETIENSSATELNLGSRSKQVSDAIRRIPVAKLRASLSVKQMSIIDKLFFKDLITRQSLDELTAQFPDRVVIADFYLPYMCCSDCPPVHYIVNEQKDEEQPAISIKVNAFCNDDKATYPVTVSPAGGVLSGEGINSGNDGFVFNPSSVLIPEDALNRVVTLTYKVGEQSASVSVTVFAKPQASFAIQPGTAYNVFLFDSSSKNAASLTWDFGDGTTASGDVVTHFYQQDGSYTVTLQSLNGPCSAKAEQVILVSKASINITPTQFCSLDKKNYPIAVSPAGGKLTGEGVITDPESGVDVFLPAAVAIEKNQTSKNVILSYSVGGQTVQQTVVLTQTPSAKFTVKPVVTAGPNVRLFIAENGFDASYIWNFNDGSEAEGAQVIHSFEKAGVYPVKLSVTNGPCNSSATQQVVIEEKPPVVQKNCGPLDDILALYSGLVQVNPAQFKTFRNLFQDFKGMDEYFQKLPGILGMSNADQIMFFEDSKAEALLNDWFTALNNLILESDIRQIALAAWRVLQELAMYILCIQKDESGKMLELFNDLGGKMKSWANAAAKMNKDDLSQLQFLIADLKTETVRIKKNNEDQTKPNYLNLLVQLINMLSAYVK
ncbi:MAG: PKD domain-containing protein [Bacteroidetes bacterium]|nr:PKD domain-containing protein [Bacteroidota bacterium]